MARHILDTAENHPSSGMKLTPSSVATEQQPGPETLALHRRPVDRASGTRLKEYMRIERGETT